MTTIETQVRVWDSADGQILGSAKVIIGDDGSIKMLSQVIDIENINCVYNPKVLMLYLRAEKISAENVEPVVYRMKLSDHEDQVYDYGYLSFPT